jgi:hypothetical protein
MFVNTHCFGLGNSLQRAALTDFSHKYVIASIYYVIITMFAMTNIMILFHMKNYKFYTK